MTIPQTLAKLGAAALAELLSVVQGKGKPSGLLDGELADAMSVEDMCDDMATQPSLPRPTSVAEALSAEV